MRRRPGKALVIVGHGSARNPHTREPICQAVKRIAATGVYDEVVCGLLKEDPKLDTVLDSVRSLDVTIVPFFISSGYYTEQVIPQKMGLCGEVTMDGLRVIRYREPVGMHPLFAEVLVDRARAAGATAADALVVLGHGTPKNPNSAKNVFLQAERVAEMKLFAEVVTVFIDQEPHLNNVLEMTTASKLVIVPLFVADGWHVSETIPADLAQMEHGTRELVYAKAVGTDPRIADLILDGAAV